MLLGCVGEGGCIYRKRMGHQEVLWLKMAALGE